MSKLISMNEAPLDGTHIMVVFNDEFKTHKIRESWVKSCTECQITGEFEYENDAGEYEVIENPLGWFDIPNTFDIIEVEKWQ